MKISVIVPSRGRVKLLKKLVLSLIRNISDINNLELIVALDNDDPDLNKYHTMFLWLSVFKNVKINKTILIRERSNDIVNFYYNEMAELTTGNVIWTLNDDCEVGIQDGLFYDQLIESKEKELGHKIYALKVYGTGIGRHGYSSFPIISRKAYEVLGFVFWPELMTFDADEVLANCFWPVERYIETPELYAHHRPVDKGAKRHMIAGYDRNCTPGKVPDNYAWIPEKLRKEIQDARD